jgi:transcriptional regulator with XRE-family HTH domain
MIKMDINSENGNFAVRHPKACREVDLELGTRIRALRKDIRMRLFDLAEIIGVSYQQIQKYEAGTNRISVASLLAIADALNADPASLIAGLPQGSREEGVDGRGHLTESSDFRRLHRLFASLKDEADRALIVEFAGYLVARGQSRSPRASTKSDGG